MKTFLLIALILLAVNVYADDQGKSLSIIPIIPHVFRSSEAFDDNLNNEDKDPSIYMYNNYNLILYVLFAVAANLRMMVLVPNLVKLK